MTQFAKRNIWIYFRDKSTVLFSLLGVFIVIALYTVFLGDNMAQGFSQLEDANLLVSSWLIAGICAIAPVTTAMGALGALVADRDTGADRDYLASPMRRSSLVGGYLAGGLLAAFILTMITLLLGGGWLLSLGVELPSLINLAKIAGVLMLTVVSGGSMVFFLVTFIKTSSAFAASSTVVGTVVGFITGIYLPIGLLPEPVQLLVKLFPTSHAASLLRYLFLEGFADSLFKGVPDAVRDEIWLELGVRYSFGDGVFPLWGSVAILAGTAVVLFVFSVLRLSKQKNG